MQVAYRPMRSGEHVSGKQGRIGAHKPQFTKKRKTRKKNKK
jgi:hypothetical protein